MDVGMNVMYIRIRGMNSGSCVRQVQNALVRVPGVHVDRVGVGDASVLYDPARTNRAAILDAVAYAGFTPEV